MITTALFADQSVGTSTNKGDGKFPQKLTADSASNAFLVAAKLVNGAADYKAVDQIKVLYTSSPYSLTAEEAVIALRKNTKYLELVSEPNAGGTTIRDSLISVLSGQYIYVWFNIPSVVVAQTLSVSVTEI